MSNTPSQKRSPAAEAREQGFTLIELSIVLVIIGLIVGGVLVGQDLIRAAEVRATISQIEKYNTAVNTFRGKYNAIPGDMPASTASAFGFVARGTNPGQGDGNGVIEGPSTASTGNGYVQAGENLQVWVDLSVGNPASALNINLIDGGFSTYTSPSVAAAAIASTALSSYFPPAKLGRGNSVYVYSTNGVNYWGVANIASISGTGNATISSPSMTVVQTYQIDKKVDDGYPVTGNVTATMGGNSTGATIAENANATAVNVGVSDTATTCYNTGSGSSPGAYSNTFNNGASATCALSFRFQ